VAVAIGAMALGACSDQPVPTEGRQQATSLDESGSTGPTPSLGGTNDAASLTQVISRGADGRTIVARANTTLGASALASRQALTRDRQADRPLFSVAANGVVTIDFEGYTVGTVLTSQYASTYGLSFSGAAVLVQGQSLNPPFPPHSGIDVIYDQTTTSAGQIAVAFQRPVSGVAVYITANASVPMTCRDRNGTVLGTAFLPRPNYVGAEQGIDPNYLLSVQSNGIMSCSWQGAAGGNSYTLDDLIFDPTSKGAVPKGPNGRSSHANLAHMCDYNGNIVPYPYFTTGFTHADDCGDTPAGSEGMNALTLKNWANLPIGAISRMQTCFYPSDQELNLQPSTAGEHWHTLVDRNPGPGCSYSSTDGIGYLFAEGEQRQVERDQ
jgi:hypothetical protein